MASGSRAQTSRKSFLGGYQLGEVKLERPKFTVFQRFEDGFNQPRLLFALFPLEILGSQNWYFGDFRTLLYTFKPFYRRVQ